MRVNSYGLRCRQGTQQPKETFSCFRGRISAFTFVPFSQYLHCANLSISSVLFPLKCTLCHIFCVTNRYVGKKTNGTFTQLRTMGYLFSLAKAKSIFLASYACGGNSISACRPPSTCSHQALRD